MPTQRVSLRVSLRSRYEKNEVNQLSNFFSPWAVLGPSWSSPVVTTSAGATPTRRRRRLVDSHDEILVRIHTEIKFTNWMRYIHKRNLTSQITLYFLFAHPVAQICIPGTGHGCVLSGLGTLPATSSRFPDTFLAQRFFRKTFRNTFLLTDCNTG